MQTNKQINNRSTKKVLLKDKVLLTFKAKLERRLCSVTNALISKGLAQMQCSVMEEAKHFLWLFHNFKIKRL